MGRLRAFLANPDEGSLNRIFWSLTIGTWVWILSHDLRAIADKMSVTFNNTANVVMPADACDCTPAMSCDDNAR